MTENKLETIVVKDEDSDCEIVAATQGQVDVPEYIDPKSLRSLLDEPPESLPPVIEKIVSTLSNDEAFDRECDKYYKANLEMDVEYVQVDVVKVLFSSPSESTKASTNEVQTITSRKRKKTNAQKCREYRERKKLQNTMVQNITAERSDECSETDQLPVKKPKTDAERRKKYYEAQKLKKQKSKKIPKSDKQRNKECYDRKKVQALNTLNYHSDVSPEAKTISLSSEIDIRTTTDLPGICSLCGDSDDHVQLLLVHLRERHQLKQDLFVCPFCDYTSIKYEVVMKHTTKVHKLVSEQHKCDQCDYKTFRGDLYNRHLNQHLKEKIYSCDHCNYKTINVINFKRHLSSKHTKETEYKCQSCDFASNNIGVVKRHEAAKHTSQKVFPCNKCPYITTLAHTLKRHQERYCKNRSENSEGLTYTCVHCNFKTESLSSLEDHTLLTHPKKEILFCNLCEYSTTESADLTKHAQEHLKNEPINSEN